MQEKELQDLIQSDPVGTGNLLVAKISPEFGLNFGIKTLNILRLQQLLEKGKSLFGNHGQT